MKRWMTVLVAVCILAILVAVVWIAYGEQIRTYLVLRRCQAAWNRVEDLETNFEVQIEVGPLELPIKGTMWFQKPDRYRIVLGSGALTECRIVAYNEKAWIYMPAFKRAIEVTFQQSSATDVVRTPSPEQWVTQLAQSKNARVVGQESVEGQKCYVVELTPRDQEKAFGMGAATPPRTRRTFKLADFVSNWDRTRLYISKKTALPVRAVAIKNNGAPIFTWTATTMSVNPGPEYAFFDFEAPKGTKIIRREFDPEHPEKLFLPPKGSSMWDDILDFLEDELKRELKDAIGVPESRGAPEHSPLKNFPRVLEKHFN